MPTVSKPVLVLSVITVFLIAYNATAAIHRHRRLHRLFRTSASSRSNLDLGFDLFTADGHENENQLAQTGGFGGTGTKHGRRRGGRRAGKALLDKVARRRSSPAVVARPYDPSMDARPKRPYHTAMTCNDSPYTRWQSRIMYFYYKKFQAMEGGEEMGGFTRVLHSGKPDQLMEEIPTFVVEPLKDDKDYVVLNRPWAFVQWLEKATIEEEYIFMAEPDHIIVKPIPNLATEHMPAAFAFFYIVPQDEEKFLRRWYPKKRGPITDIDPIGNSPSIIKKDDLKRIAPLWMNVSLEFMADPEIVKSFEWVLEMYAYATASAMLNYSHILRRDFMVQPPYDTVVGDTFIIHYTYGQDFDLNGRFLPGKVGPWHFDKRDYDPKPIPRNLTYPPKGSPETVFELIRLLNEASNSIPNWEAAEE